MIVKLLTEHHLEFLSLKGGCRGSSESTHVKMRYCWKSRVMAHITSHTSPPPSLSADMMTFCLKKSGHFENCNQYRTYITNIKNIQQVTYNEVKRANKTDLVIPL